MTTNRLPTGWGLLWPAAADGYKRCWTQQLPGALRLLRKKVGRAVLCAPAASG
jgi:hypothetical protein